MAVSLALGMLGVGDSITDDVLKEDLQHTSGFFVDESRDTLDTTSASKTTDGWLGDTLDVITQHLPVTLGASLSKTFSSFATSRHDLQLMCMLEISNNECSTALCLQFI